MPALKSCIALLTLLMLIAATPRPAAANGWEHGALPFDALVNALQSEAAGTRAVAARSLGFRAEAEAAAMLLRHLAAGEDEDRVRMALYGALGRLGDGRGFAALAACLDREERDDVRAICIAALGKLGDERAVALIIARFEGDPSFLVKSRAVDALGQFSSDRVVTYLAGLLAAKGNRSLAQRALVALGQTRSRAAVQPVIEALNKAKNDQARAMAITALTKIASPAALDVLLEMLDGPALHPGLRARIVIALGVIGEPHGRDSLLALLRDPDPAIRYLVVEALGRLEDVAAVPVLIALTLSISERLDGMSTDRLLARANSVIADLSVQIAIQDVLISLAPGDSLEALLGAAVSPPLSKDSSAGLKLAEGYYQRLRSALYGLGYTASRRALAPLLGDAGLNNPDPRLRAVAVRSLGVLGLGGTLDPLIAALEDDVPDVRRVAARVLGLLGDRRAVGGMIAGLADNHRLVRREAALGLGYIGDTSARPALESLAADDPERTVREAARASLDLL